MEKKNGNNTIWDEVIAWLHGDRKEEHELSQDIQVSGEYKFAKKLASVRDQAKQVREISSPDQAWNQFLDKQPKRRILPGIFKYAAVVTIAFMVGSLFTWMVTRTDEQIASVAYSTVEVPYGQMSKITLSDGTAVWLNSGTTLRYPNIFDQENRSVEINGEGFFDVTTDPEHPFIVETNDINVRVLGTSFNVNSYEEDAETEVTLLEGKVELLSLAGTRLAGIIPGEQAVLNDKGLSINKVDTRLYDSWKEGRMEFSGVQLGDIVKKLERWYNVDISLDGKMIEETKISGTIMRYKPIDQILRAMKIMGDFDYSLKSNPSGKDQITIFKR